MYDTRDDIIMPVELVKRFDMIIYEEKVLNKERVEKTMRT